MEKVDSGVRQKKTHYYSDKETYDNFEASPAV